MAAARVGAGPWRRPGCPVKPLPAGGLLRSNLLLVVGTSVAVWLPNPSKFGLRNAISVCLDWAAKIMTSGFSKNKRL